MRFLSVAAASNCIVYRLDNTHYHGHAYAAECSETCIALQRVGLLKSLNFINVGRRPRSPNLIIYIKIPFTMLNSCSVASPPHVGLIERVEKTFTSKGGVS